MIISSERVHARAGVLVVQQARLDDAGRYVCHANNSAGSERVELEVSIISTLSIRLAPVQVSSYSELIFLFACLFIPLLKIQEDFFIQLILCLRLKSK